MERSPAIAAVFEPVAPPSTFEETVARLGTAIRVGVLAPGTRLPPERELADQLSISRSTLRAAITTLVQSGLLASVRGRGGGTFVSAEPPLTGPPWFGAPGAARLGRAARDVLDERVAVETGAAILAAERRTDEDIAAMAAQVERMAAVESADFEDFDEYRRADIRFHIALAEAADSPRLVAMMTEVQGRMSDLITRIPHPEEVLMRSNDQHRRLVGHLRKRDGAGAARLAREHLEGTEHILEGLMPAAADTAPPPPPRVAR